MCSIATAVATAVVDTFSQGTKVTPKSFVATAFGRQASTVTVAGFHGRHVHRAAGICGTRWSRVSFVAQTLMHTTTDFRTGAVCCTGAIGGAGCDLSTAAHTSKPWRTGTRTVDIVAIATSTALERLSWTDHQRAIVALETLPTRAFFCRHSIVQFCTFAVPRAVVGAPGLGFGTIWAGNLLRTVGAVEAAVADATAVQTDALRRTIVETLHGR